MRRMLDDRTANVASVKAIGSKLTGRVDSTDKQQLQDALADLDLRWEKLTNAAMERWWSLEEMLDTAKVFHEQVEPFVQWLESTEKKVSALDNIGSDVAKIEQQIDAQKVGRSFRFIYKACMLPRLI